MPRIEADAIVPVNIDTAFELSQTYGEIRYRWDPLVREQRLLNGAEHAGKGVRTWTRSRHHLVMETQYVTYAPPSHVGMRMLEGPWFFKSFSGGWNFTSTGSNETRATWRYNFTCRPRWLCFLADRVGVHILRRDIRRRIAAFARACADPKIIDELRRTTPDSSDRST
jgi:ribosome-associated toxin RatA of RatAB toxin-antitoxin module